MERTFGHPEGFEGPAQAPGPCHQADRAAEGSWPQSSQENGFASTKFSLNPHTDLRKHGQPLWTQPGEDPGHLIKAHQAGPNSGEPPVHITILPGSLQRRQQESAKEWLERQKQQVLAASAPTLPEFHLQLPPPAAGHLQAQSAFAGFEPLESPWKAQADSAMSDISSTVDVKEASPVPQAKAPLSAYEMREESDWKLLRQASSIKPRDRVVKATSSLRSVASQGALASRASGGSSSSGSQADGVMMLLRACEALDMNPRLSSSPSSSTHSPKRPPRSRNVSSDLTRIRASFSRAFSDSLVDAPRPCSGAARRQEKENAASLSLLGQAGRKASGAVTPKPPKPIKPRKSRSELHGPCCHCNATESPQWRKGPKCKPILCNACGTRFLRTRSLGKSTGKGAGKKSSFSSASSCNLDDAVPMETAGSGDLGVIEDARSSLTSSQDACPDAQYQQDLSSTAVIA